MLQKLLTITLGFVVAMTLCGCAGNDTGPDTASTEDGHANHKAEAGQVEAHPSEGPRGGHLIELGDEAYHAEFLHDETSHAVVVHILDAEGKQDVAIEQSEIVLQIFKDGQFVEHALKAAGENSPASKFSLVDENLCSLLHAEDLRGRLNVTIEGKTYNGVIEHHEEDHEGHNH